MSFILASLTTELGGDELCETDMGDSAPVIQASMDDFIVIEDGKSNETTTGNCSGKNCKR